MQGAIQVLGFTFIKSEDIEEVQLCIRVHSPPVWVQVQLVHE